MAENERPGRGAGENEGEGSRSADRRHRDAVQRTVRQGHVEEDAERARRDVETDQEAFRRAEEEGKRRSAGEAPGDVKSTPSARRRR